MRTVTVNASKKYDVFIEKGLVSKSGEIIKNLTSFRKAAVITDNTVAGLYLKTVVDSMKENGFEVHTFSFPAGEASKCHRTLIAVYDFLAEAQITRSDVIVALGGGVVGDLAGYAAATYLRGVDFVQIPTTLLAQVDSSVGGKTAVDINAGKNLVGAFKQPLCVICDTDALLTLSEDIFADGMGEVVKYGMIKSAPLFEKLLSGDVKDSLEDVIAECVSIKRDVVEADEFEKGDRMLLNFGHTLGHAIEKYYNFSGISHGKAVAIGMAEFTRLAEEKDLCKKGTFEKLKKCLEKNLLPFSCDISLKELAPLCLSDKKRKSDGINIVLCSEVGKSFIKKLGINEFYDFLNVR